MAEIVLWQEHGSVLSALCEQLKQPVVEKILEVLTKTNSGIVSTLERMVAKLTKYRLESEDNIRFLKALERHFMVSCPFVKCIIAQSSLQSLSLFSLCHRLTTNIWYLHPNTFLE